MNFRGVLNLRKLETLELQEISLEEIISYSKEKGRPVVTILDELTASQFNYVVAYADLLKLIYFIVKDTRKVAFIGTPYIALKIAKNMQVKAQVVHYHKPIREIGLKSNLERKHNREIYIVKAYDKYGNKTEPFIDTDIPSVSCDNLNKYDFRDFKYNVVARNNKNGKVDILEIKALRKQYLVSSL